MRLHAGGELVLVRGEIQPRRVLAVHRRDAAIGEHAVDAEMAGVVGHVVDAAVAEVGQDVREVQARHGDLADAHLEEGAERRVDALFALGVAEAGGGGDSCRAP